MERQIPELDTLEDRQALDSMIVGYGAYREGDKIRLKLYALPGGCGPEHTMSDECAREIVAVLTEVLGGAKKSERGV